MNTLDALEAAENTVFALTAAHSREDQDRALETIVPQIAKAGRQRWDSEDPQDRYDVVAAYTDKVSDYEFLAGRVAGAEAAPQESGLAGDPLTQALHDVYSNAQWAEQEDRQADDFEAGMAEAEANARWHAACDADLDARDRGW